MSVMTNKGESVIGDYTYTLLGVEQTTHLLINNHKTNTDSVIVPVAVLINLLESE